MDWTSLFPMLGALLGSLVTGGLMFLAQRAAQRNENLRHARKLALELAVAEWQRHFDWLKAVDATRAGVKFRPVDEYFIRYLPVVETLLQCGKRHRDPDALVRELDQAVAWQKHVIANRITLHHAAFGDFPDFWGKPPAAAHKEPLQTKR